MSSSRGFLAALVVALSALLAACGGGGDGTSDGGASSAGSDLPAGCDNAAPLEVSVPGVPELSGPMTVAGGVALPFALLPDVEGRLVDLSEGELEDAVAASDLVAYGIAVTDFPFGPDDAGSFYSLFSMPTLPEEGGTALILTVLPPDGALAAGSVVEVGAELSYGEDLQSTAVSTSVWIETNRADAPLLGGIDEDFTGSVEVLALTEDTICVRWSTSSPILAEDGFVTVEGVVAAPLLPLNARNSMG